MSKYNETLQKSRDYWVRNDAGLDSQADISTITLEHGHWVDTSKDLKLKKASPEVIEVLELLDTLMEQDL